MNNQDPKENYGAEAWRAPEIQKGDKIVFSECGRLLPSVGGRAGDMICYRSHYFRVVRGQYGGFRLLVKHGGGQEEIPLGGEYRGLIPVLATLDSDSRYIALYALYDVNKEATYKAERATKEEYMTAFLEGRMKSRKCKRETRFWIEDKKP